MNLSIGFQEDSGYLLCTITGKWVTDELKGFIDKIAADARRRECRRILADMSEVTGPPPEMDRYNIGKYVAHVFPGIKIAIIYHKVYVNNFFEDTAVNRGAWLKVFSDKKNALPWLLYSKPDTPVEGKAQ